MRFLSNSNKGTLFCVISGFLYGAIGYFGVSIMNTNIAISNMLFWRYLLSSIFTFFMLLPQIRNIKLDYKQLRYSLFVGFFFYGSFSYLYFLACRYIGSGLSMVIFFVYPAMVMMINQIFYK